MRQGAHQIGRPRPHNTMVNNQAVESELGLIGHLKNSLSIASRGARRLGALPENCHLLPSAAIYGHFVAAKPLCPFQPLHSLPAGIAGQPVIGHWKVEPCPAATYVTGGVVRTFVAIQPPERAGNR
jgi:hypothetical protein